MVFCDESSQREDFFVVGGLYFRPPQSVTRLRWLRLKEDFEWKAQHSPFSTVGKDSPASQHSKLEGYKALIKDLATHQLCPIQMYAGGLRVGTRWIAKRFATAIHEFRVSDVIAGRIAARISSAELSASSPLGQCASSWQTRRVRQSNSR